MSRFIIEGTYDGCILHRSEHPASSKALRAWAEKTAEIAYEDGSTLSIVVRDCAPGERVESLDNCSYIIGQCARYDVDSVDALIAAEKLA